MKRQVFTLLMALVLAFGTVALVAQTTPQEAAKAQQPSQQVDQSGKPETGPGPDVDVDVGKNANGAVDVDVKRHTDPDTAASGVDETGTGNTAQTTGATGTTANNNSNLPATGSEMPLVGLIGLMALAGTATLRAIR